MPAKIEFKGISISIAIIAKPTRQSCEIFYLELVFSSSNLENDLYPIANDTGWLP